MKRLHALYHVPFESLAAIEPWAMAHGFDVTVTRLYARESLPEPASADLIVIMGGPMGIYDEDAYPWLRDEQAYLTGCLNEGKTMLGICLGAQLLANVLGGQVTKNREKEIGWFPVDLHAEGKASPLFKDFPDSFVPLHWHGDTFSVPEGCELLAGSKGCAHQAFQLVENGRIRVAGLQFHLEITPDRAADMISHNEHELVPAPFIQQTADILGNVDAFKESRRLLETFLTNLVQAAS